MKNLALYVHIPFCIKKCDYCDFLSAPATLGTQREYVAALCQEIRTEAALAAEYQVASVFFGGGTPSILESGRIAELLKTIRSCYTLVPEAEITVECNPGTLTSDKLTSYRQAGVNRLSIGLQSADNAELKALGRIHTWEQFLESFALARKAGFDNINIDLMSALPGQTLASYEATLHRVLALQPEHISAYSLIIEEGTPFYERYGERAETVSWEPEELSTGKPHITEKACAGERNGQQLPDEDTERQMYERTRQLLAEAGYERYEISNYAKPGRECLHNLCYWERTPYLGFGIGAASLFQECRFSRERDLKAYIRKLSMQESTRIEQEQLGVQEQMEEYMFLGLRKMRGVSISEFQSLYGRSMSEVYGTVLEKYQKLGLLAIKDDRVALTTEGINVSNMVFSDFLL